MLTAGEACNMSKVSELCTNRAQNLSCVLDGLTTMNKFSAPRINIL